MLDLLVKEENALPLVKNAQMNFLRVIGKSKKDLENQNLPRALMIDEKTDVLEIRYLLENFLISVKSEDCQKQSFDYHRLESMLLKILKWHNDPATISLTVKLLGMICEEVIF